MALHFELVSPARLLFSGDVTSVQIPGTEGEMTILAGHSPVLSTLKPGVVVVHKDGGAADKIFVRGGFAEVGEGGVTAADVCRELVPDRQRPQERVGVDGAVSERPRIRPPGQAIEALQERDVEADVVADDGPVTDEGFQRRRNLGKAWLALHHVIVNVGDACDFR